jgi:hypothetical protein
MPNEMSFKMTRVPVAEAEVFEFKPAVEMGARSFVRKDKSRGRRLLAG